MNIADVFRIEANDLVDRISQLDAKVEPLKEQLRFMTNEKQVLMKLLEIKDPARARSINLAKRKMLDDLFGECVS